MFDFSYFGRLEDQVPMMIGSIKHVLYAPDGSRTARDEILLINSGCLDSAAELHALVTPKPCLNAAMLARDNRPPTIQEAVFDHKRHGFNTALANVQAEIRAIQARNLGRVARVMTPIADNARLGFPRRMFDD